MSAPDIAAANFARHLQHNTYPGRGLVVGRASDNTAWLMLYWIMGRSAQSQNRIFVTDGGTLRTEPRDASLVDDPSLIIYEAMLELPGLYLVGNGDQVRTLCDALQAGSSFDAALATRAHEPDAPHYTPRISAMLDLRHPPGTLTLSILKANVANPKETDRITYRPARPLAGFGLGLTTYRGDGNPLPSFQGDPLLLPCAGTPHDLIETYWQVLDATNRIALAVKHIPDDATARTLLVRNRFAA
jgi:hypothetical protein